MLQNISCYYSILWHRLTEQSGSSAVIWGAHPCNQSDNLMQIVVLTKELLFTELDQKDYGSLPWTAFTHLAGWRTWSPTSIYIDCIDCLPWNATSPQLVQRSRISTKSARRRILKEAVFRCSGGLPSSESVEPAAPHLTTRQHSELRRTLMPFFAI